MTIMSKSRANIRIFFKNFFLSKNLEKSKLYYKIEKMNFHPNLDKMRIFSSLKWNVVHFSLFNNRKIFLHTIFVVRGF